MDFSAALQSDFGRDIERPRNNSNQVRFYYPYEDSNRFNASYDRMNIGGLDVIKVSGFLGTFDQRTDQDRVPTPARARDIARADVSASDFQVRASAQKAFSGGRVEFGADVNGRFGLEAHDILIQYDLAGNITSNTDNLSTESAHRTDTGMFVEGDKALGAKVTLAGGLRVDYVSNVNEGGYFGDQSVSNGAAAGFGAITAKVASNTTLTAQVSRGFRDPTLSDRFYRGPTGRGFITGNPDLKPETSLQFDLGAQQTTGRLRMAGYYYYYRINDLVERYQTETDFFFFRNRGRAEVKGFEFETQADLSRGFSLEVAAQIGRGHAIDDDAALDDISPDTISFVVRKAFTSRIGAYVRVANHADDDRPGPSEIAAPGHTNLDLGASWQAIRGLEVRGLVRNLLNEQYYASPDPRWVYAAGINGAVTVAVKF